MPKQKQTILVLHGPNLNLLGVREPDIYGINTLHDINQKLVKLAAKAGCKLICEQSNSEQALIEAIHKAGQQEIQFIIINPAAFTHTSIALRDAFLAVSIPFVEVHLSNVFAREEFRTKSYFSDIAVGVITGFGAKSYELALQVAIDYVVEV